MFYYSLRLALALALIMPTLTRGEDEDEASNVATNTSTDFALEGPMGCTWGDANSTVEDVAGRFRSRGSVLPTQWYIISAVGSKDRMSNVACLSAQVERQGSEIPGANVTARIFPAIMGGGTRVKEAITKGDVRSSSLLKPGELGAYLSHIEVWREAMNQGLEAVAVLEDDASILPDAMIRLTGSMAELPEGWEILWLFEGKAAYLGGAMSLGHRPSHIEGKSYIARKRHGIGLDGYVISRAGMRRLLGILVPVENQPIDLALHRLIVEGKLEAYLSNPPIIYDTYRKSSIIQGRMYHELVGINRRFQIGGATPPPQVSHKAGSHQVDDDASPRRDGRRKQQSSVDGHSKGNANSSLSNTKNKPRKKQPAQAIVAPGVEPASQTVAQRRKETEPEVPRGAGQPRANDAGNTLQHVPGKFPASSDQRTTPLRDKVKLRLSASPI